MSRPEDLLTDSAKMVLKGYVAEYEKELARKAVSEALADGNDQATEKYIDAVATIPRDGSRRRWVLRFAVGSIWTLLTLNVATLRSDEVLRLSGATQTALWTLPFLLIPWLLILTYVLRYDLR